MHRTVCAVVALGAAGLLACSPALDPLPPGGQVTCAGDEDCPSGSFCSPALGNLCVPRGGADQTAPAIVGTPTVTPPSARAGTPVTVAFEVSEDLALPPEVRLQGAPDTLGTPSRSGRVYTVEFPAVTAMGSGPHTIVARLVDGAANVADTVPVGTLTLDFTPPEAAPPTVTPDFARLGTVVAASITFTEPLGGTPSLRIGSVDGPSLTAAPGAGANAWSFGRTIDGTEPPGPVDLFLHAEDAAGNPLELRYTDAVTLDYVAPKVVPGPVATPSVRRGQTFVSALEFDEPLGGTPVVELVPSGSGSSIPVIASALDASHYALSVDVPPSAPDGAFTLTLASAADRAGNPVALTVLGSVIFDSTPPGVTGLAPDRANRLYRAGQTVAATFTLDEDAPAGPAVRLEAAGGSLDMPCVAAAARSYTCTSPAISSTLLDGTASISVSVADAAGNTRVVSTPVLLDFTAPGLASTPASRYLGTAATRNVNVRAVGTASSWEIAILASERLSGAPDLVATQPGGGATRTLVLQSSNAPTNTSFTYLLPSSATAYPAATWAVTWNPTDLAGNAASTPVQIAAVDVDGVAPAAPATGSATAPALVWTRTPWGTDTSPTPLFQVGASAASVGGDADVMIAWDGSGAGARELARASVSGGAFTVPLGSDPADLWVSTLDRAGNESARTRVVDVVWTAGLGGKVAGSTFENPHRLDTRTYDFRGLVQQDAVEVPGTALGVRGDGSVVSTTGRAALVPVAGLDSPPANASYELAADDGRGVLVLAVSGFGGGFEETWEWDGSSWTRIVASDPEGDGNPVSVSQMYASAAYDPVRGGVVLAADHLFVWTGRSWKRIDGTATTAPAGLTWPQVAWDESRSVLVMLGGNATGQMETWEWDGLDWRNVTPAASGDSPATRFGHQLAWDPVRKRVTVFGGQNYLNNTGYYADTWTWNGTRWAQLATAGAITARSRFAMAWDAARDELVVQGGEGVGSTFDGKTYVLRFGGATPTWVDVTPPSPVLQWWDSSAAYDRRSGRVLVYYGVPGTFYAWRGAGPARWDLLAPSDPEGDGNPRTITGTATVHVAPRDRGVFVDTFGVQTWEWNNASWARLANGTGPASRSYATVGVHGSNVILFGGALQSNANRVGDTWRWDGTSWTMVVADPGRPVPNQHTDALRASSGAGWDTAAGRLFRFGGEDAFAKDELCYSDVWEWRTTTDGRAPAVASDRWLKLGGEPWADPEADGSPAGGTTGPVCNASGKVLWHVARSSLLFYDVATIWEWRPSTNSWQRHVMTGAPPSTLQGLFWDMTLAAPVVLDQTRAYVVDLTANTYRSVELANPYAFVLPTTAKWGFDAARGRGLGVDYQRTWTFDAGIGAGPAHRFTVSFASANGPDPWLCVNRPACPIQRVDVAWSGGASAPTGNGSRLQVWNGSWLDAATNGSTAGAPSNMTWSWTPASTFPASSLFHGPSRELSLGLVPVGAATSVGMAQVASDAVAVTVRYRRP